MALLTVDKRKEFFKFLGLGEYNDANIKKFQKIAFPKLPKEQDGKYGTKTDIALRHWVNVRKWTKNFEPEEFKCECGGKYCTGYPSWMKKVELQNLQSIRDHYGKPMLITCGLRCRPYNNSLRGSIPNSKHLSGYATDFYMLGVTDTLPNRKKSISWIKKLPNHNYTYGNGINSNGVNVAAGYMGNCIHTDTNAPKATAKPATKADPLQKWYDAMKTQYNWSKNQIYKWVTPTVASSKTKGTCITFPMVSLQRLGLIGKGQYFYFHPQQKQITGTAAAYVKKHTELFKLSYPNKTIKELWKAGQIKKGDIIGFGNPYYHTMVFMGMKDGKPIFNTMGSKRGLSIYYPLYASRKVNMIVRLKKTTK